MRLLVSSTPSRITIPTAIIAPFSLDPTGDDMLEHDIEIRAVRSNPATPIMTTVIKNSFANVRMTAYTDLIRKTSQRNPKGTGGSTMKQTSTPRPKRPNASSVAIEAMKDAGVSLDEDTQVDYFGFEETFTGEPPGWAFVRRSIQAAQRGRSPVVHESGEP